MNFHSLCPRICVPMKAINLDLGVATTLRPTCRVAVISSEPRFGISVGGGSFWGFCWICWEFLYMIYVRYVYIIQIYIYRNSIYTHILVENFMHPYISCLVSMVIVGVSIWTIGVTSRFKRVLLVAHVLKPCWTFSCSIWSPYFEWFVHCQVLSPTDRNGKEGSES